MSWRALLSRLLEPSPRMHPRPRPAAPPGWNKTLADLTAERRRISGDELHWARGYEREQLRPWARFPKNGELFEALQDLKVTYVIDWQGPFSSGGEGVLAKGARIRVAVFRWDPEPIVVQATPLDKQGFAERFIRADERASSKYGDYSLALGLAQLNKAFRLIS